MQKMYRCSNVFGATRNGPKTYMIERYIFGSAVKEYTADGIFMHEEIYVFTCSDSIAKAVRTPVKNGTCKICLAVVAIARATDN